MAVGRTIDRTIAALSIAATLLVGWVALRATIDTANWGGVPPKRLKASYIGPTDPLDDLSRGSTVQVTVLSGGEPVRNLRIIQATLENTGATPILPADMVEPLSIKSEKNWRIVGVGNQPLLAGAAPQLQWTRVNDGEFTSAASLINPGDTVWATVYLSWTGAGEPPARGERAVSWRTRIANLRGIETGSDAYEEVMRRSGPIEVRLWGWGVPFTTASFAVYCLLTVLLLARGGLIRTDRPITLAIVPLTGLVNLAAAEAGATYVFGVSPFIPIPVSHWANLPPILLNIVMIAVLLFLSWPDRRTPIAD
ncbi:MAG: hypothetical protein PGN12_01620 [Sphingomonas phyllosphaerae]